MANIYTAIYTLDFALFIIYTVIKIQKETYTRMIQSLLLLNKGHGGLSMPIGIFMRVNPVALPII